MQTFSTVVLPRHLGSHTQTCGISSRHVQASPLKPDWHSAISDLPPLAAGPGKFRQLTWQSVITSTFHSNHNSPLRAIPMLSLFLAFSGTSLGRAVLQRDSCFIARCEGEDTMHCHSISIEEHGQLRIKVLLFLVFYRRISVQVRCIWHIDPQ